MKKYFISTFIAILIILLLIPDNGVTQTPARKKRSDNLTRAAIKLYQAQKVVDAKEKLLQAVKLNNKNVLAHEMLALIFYKGKKFQLAIKHANIAVQADKKSARAYYILGMISYEQGNKKQAKAELTQSMKFLKDPDRRSHAKKVLDKLKNTFDGRRIKKVASKLRPFKDKSQSNELHTGYKPYVAIFDFLNANARSEKTELGTTLTEMLVTALIQNGRFVVMERVQLEKVLKEQSLSQSGVIDTETVIEVGKLAGLEAIILGSVSQLKTSIEADARLIDVETGKALAAVHGKVKDVDKIRKLAKELARQLGAKAGLIVSKQEVDEKTKSEK